MLVKSHKSVSNTIDKQFKKHDNRYDKTYDENIKNIIIKMTNNNYYKSAFDEIDERRNNSIHSNDIAWGCCAATCVILIFLFITIMITMRIINDPNKKIPTHGKITNNGIINTNGEYEYKLNGCKKIDKVIPIHYTTEYVGKRVYGYVKHAKCEKFYENKNRYDKLKREIKKKRKKFKKTANIISIIFCSAALITFIYVIFYCIIGIIWGCMVNTREYEYLKKRNNIV